MDQHRINLPNTLDQNFGLCISPQDLLLPHYNFPVPYLNYYRPWKCYYMQKLRDFGSTICDEKDKFKIFLDVQHFQPSEISVKVANNEIIIEGNHEERRDNHGLISRRFKRRYIMPKDCNADSVVSSLSSDGVLIVTADKARDQGKKEIIVPIHICSQTTTKDTAKLDSDMKSKLVIEPIKQEVVKDKTEPIKQEVVKDKTALAEADKKKTATMLKEDHCRLLKPELLGEAAAATVKKMESTVGVAAAESFSLNTEMCSKVSAQSELKAKSELTSASFEQKSEDLSCSQKGQKTGEKCELLSAQREQKTGEKSDLSIGIKTTEPLNVCSVQSGQKTAELSELSSAQNSQSTGEKSELSRIQSGQKTAEKSDLSSVQSGQKTTVKSEKSSAQNDQKTREKIDLSSAQSGIKSGEKSELSSAQKSKEKTSASKFETMESIAGASMQTESCAIKNMVSETIEVQQSSSSYSSSMSSSFQETTAKINELVSDITAQLKEAAENI